MNSEISTTGQPANVPSAAVAGNGDADEQFFADSSHGLLRIDAEGYVTDREICRAGTCDDCIGKIERFDLEEYRRVFGEIVSDFDVLNLAGWFAGGERFEADEDYRREAAENMN